MGEELKPDLAIKYQAQKLVDDEIERLRSKIRSLLTHRNTLSPISRLPSEILSRIFAFTQSPTYYYPSDIIGTTTYDWIIVTYICRAWRYTALGCATLWTSINTRHNFVDTFVERSLGATLRCNIDSRFGPVDWALRFLKEIRRISYMRLTVTGEDSEKVFASLCSPAPLLQNLTISHDKSYVLPFIGVSVTNGLVLPENTFIGTSPNLLTLSLTGCSISPNIQILSTVTSLSIVDPGVTHVRSQWLAILANMPYLDQLTLEDAFDDISPDAGPLATRLLSTIRLSKLVLKGRKCSSDLAFFNHFTVANDAEVSFSSITSTWDDDGLILFLHYHATVRQEFSRMAIYRMSVQYRDNIFILHAFHADPNFMYTVGRYPSLIHFKLSCTENGMEATRRDSWIEALTTLPLVNLVTLEYDIQIPSHLWPILLRHSPQLTGVRIIGDYSNGFLEYLLDNYTKTYPDAEALPRHSKAEEKKGCEWAAMVFPKLKFLTLELCNMGSLPNANQLGKAFKARGQNGAPLDKFCITLCETYDGEWLARMMYFIPVDWDGELPDGDDDNDDDDDDDDDDYGLHNEWEMHDDSDSQNAPSDAGWGEYF